MIIDGHMHVKGGDRYLREFDPEDIVHALDLAGVDKAVIFSICLPSRESNDLTLKAYKKYPDRFIPYAHVIPSEGEMAVEELHRAIKDLGFQGLKIHFTDVNMPEVSEELLAPVLEATAELGIPCLVDCTEKLGLMRDLVVAYPKLNFIIAHLGSHGNEVLIDQFIWLAKTTPNVWLDTSYSDRPWKIGDAVKVAGPEKLIWGSDGLLYHPLPELAKTKALELPPDQEAMITGGNLARLLNLA